MKKKQLLIVAFIAVLGCSLSGCYVGRYHPHYYHHYR